MSGYLWLSYFSFFFYAFFFLASDTVTVVSLSLPLIDYTEFMSILMLRRYYFFSLF